MEIKTKFSFDQKVWLMKDNKVESAIVDFIKIEKYKSGFQL